MSLLAPVFVLCHVVFHVANTMKSYVETKAADKTLTVIQFPPQSPDFQVQDVFSAKELIHVYICFMYFLFVSGTYTFI